MKKEGIEIKHIKSSQSFEKPKKHFTSSKTLLKSVTLNKKQSKRESEIHKNKTDIYLILNGKGTLYYGEGIKNSTRIEKDEIRGNEIKNCKKTSLQPQSLVKIPCGVAHRVEAKTDTMLILILKIMKQKE